LFVVLVRIQECTTHAFIIHLECGTNLNRSFLIRIPFTRQIPCVLYTIRNKALRKSRKNFSWRVANCDFASLESVSLPSSNALNVGDVSSVPLFKSFI